MELIITIITRLTVFNNKQTVKCIHNDVDVVNIYSNIYLLYIDQILFNGIKLVKVSYTESRIF